MPSPVDALPCGSRSMMSTRSPMAASAVPRLIAVVVLPTPPFWLASEMMRGAAVGAGGLYSGYIWSMTGIAPAGGVSGCLVALDAVEFDDPGLSGQAGMEPRYYIP